jgi:hypothetical protein
MGIAIIHVQVVAHMIGIMIVTQELQIMHLILITAMFLVLTTVLTVRFMLKYIMETHQLLMVYGIHTIRGYTQKGEVAVWNAILTHMYKLR